MDLRLHANNIVKIAHFADIRNFSHKNTSIFDARLKIHPLSVANTESDRGEICVCFLRGQVILKNPQTIHDLNPNAHHKRIRSMEEQTLSQS